MKQEPASDTEETIQSEQLLNELLDEDLQPARCQTCYDTKQIQVTEYPPIFSQCPDCANGPPNELWHRYDDLLKHVKALGAAASILKKRHKYSSSCDFPNTCGGCHFWSGVIEACNDIVSGDKTTIRKAAAIVKRDKLSAQQ